MIRTAYLVLKMRIELIIRIQRYNITPMCVHTFTIFNLLARLTNMFLDITYE